MSDATIDPHAVLAALGAPEAKVIAPVSGGWDTMIWRVERGWRQGYREVAGPQPHMGLFYAWAGAVIVRDLTPKVGRPGVSLTPRDLQAMQHWALTWQRRAGVTP